MPPLPPLMYSTTEATKTTYTGVDTNGAVLGKVIVTNEKKMPVQTQQNDVASKGKIHIQGTTLKSVVSNDMDISEDLEFKGNVKNKRVDVNKIQASESRKNDSDASVTIGGDAEMTIISTLVKVKGVLFNGD